MQICLARLSSLQRRTMRLCSVYLLALVGLSVAARWAYQSDHSPKALLYAMALLPAAPVALMLRQAGRYLGQETDEYIRLLVMRALLWGFGITLVADVALGGMARLEPEYGRLLPILSIDLFAAVTGIAVRVQLWRNR